MDYFDWDFLGFYCQVLLNCIELLLEQGLEGFYIFYIFFIYFTFFLDIKPFFCLQSCSSVTQAWHSDKSTFLPKYFPFSFA